jgi:hypothetical protein
LADETLMIHFSTRLKHVRVSLESMREKSTSGVDWKKIDDVLKISLREASCIARSRPINYYDIWETHPVSSIAVEACTIINGILTDFYFGEFLIDALVESILLEIAIVVVCGGNCPSGRMATFATLRSLLVSPKEYVARRACEAISRFCYRYRVATSSGDQDFFLFLRETISVFYQCDGCGLYPLTGERLSLGDDALYIDLCRACFGKATDFAQRMEYDAGADVVIDDKAVGLERRLNCADVQRLSAVSIPCLGESEGSPGVPCDTAEELVHRQNLFDEFVNKLFCGTLALLADGKGLLLSRKLCIGDLAVDLVCLSDSLRKSERGQRVVRELISKAVASLALLKGLEESISTYAVTYRECAAMLRCLAHLCADSSNGARHEVGMLLKGGAADSVVLHLELLECLKTMSAEAPVSSHSVTPCLLGRSSSNLTERDVRDGVFCSREKLGRDLQFLAVVVIGEGGGRKSRIYCFYS